MALLVFVGGLAAGFMNVIAGGGSLVTMPLLMLAGLPETTANGTARLAVFTSTSTAAFRFHREGAVDWRVAGPLMLPMIAGATAGALLGTRLSPGQFRSILAVAALAAGAIVAIDLRRFLGRPDAPRLTVPLLGALLAIGFYGGLIQAGVGYLLLAALTLVGSFGLVTANVYKVLLVWSYTPIAVGIFAFGGHVDLKYGLVLAVGQSIGAWIAAGLALRKGERLIRAMIVVALIMTALHLVGLF